MDPAWVTAAIAFATTVLAGLAWGLRWAWKILRQTGHFLDDWRGQPERDGMPARPGVMARLTGLEGQMTGVANEIHVNSGHSLRDVVQRTAADVSEIKTTVNHNVERLDAISGRVELFEAQRAQRMGDGK